MTIYEDISEAIIDSLPLKEIRKVLRKSDLYPAYKGISTETIRRMAKKSSRLQVMDAVMRRLKRDEPQNATYKEASKVADEMYNMAQRLFKEVLASKNSKK